MGEDVIGQEVVVAGKKSPSERRLSPEGRRFVDGINNWLNDPEVREAQYVEDDGTSVASRFIVVESANGLTQVAIRRSLGIADTDIISIRWLNEKQKKAGNLNLSDIYDEDLIGVSRGEQVVDESYIDYWKLQGGMGNVPLAREKADFPPERIGQLATLFEQGHVNPEMTKAAAYYFETEKGGITLRRADNVVRPTSPPIRATAEVTKEVVGK